MTATKVKMPGGIRAKLMSAIAMLLVASILMVTTTYAWFTLSTAPEVTGITTSVGANGNLEIALLTKQTYDNPDQISSAVGDSSAVKEAKVANITWGNLVDLSDASYGLEKINLLPAALNVADGKVGVSPLMTPIYGADGRVEKTEGNTTSAVYDNEDGGWNIFNNIQDYGVRAVGTANGLSTRQVALTAAKKNVSSYLSQANSTITAAIAANINGLAALALAENDTVTITPEQAGFIYELAVAVNTSVNYIEKAYRQAVLAAAASDNSVDEATFAALNLAINTLPLTGSNSLYSQTGVYSNDITKIADMKTKASAALTPLGALKTSGGTAAEFKAAAPNYLVEGAYSKDGTNVIVKNDTASSLLGDIANYSGPYSYDLAGFAKLDVQQNDDKTGELKSAVNNLQAFGTSSSDKATLNDLYGYIIDFAFRTNAATSNLQLQTTETNRVYGDGSDATQGAGSYLSFVNQGGMTPNGIKAMLGAVRVVFFNTADNTIYGTAAVKANTIAQKGNGAWEGDLYLIDTVTSITKTIYNLGKDAYTQIADSTDYALKSETYPAAADKTVDHVRTITEYTNYKLALTQAEYNALPRETTSYTDKSTSYDLKGDKSAITALTQNEVHKISAMVYLEGDLIDNGDTVNAASAGALSLNLQFSSSAELKPMENTALKQLQSADVDAVGVSITENSGTLTAALNGEDYNEAITSTVWTSSDESVATINIAGKIHAEGNGQVTFAALVKTNHNNIYTAAKQYIFSTPSTGAYFMKGETPITETYTLATAKNASFDEEVTLKLALNPETTTDVLDTERGITWTSSSEGVATVHDGKVTAVSDGTTTVKAEYYVEGNDTLKSKTVTINVVTAATEVTSKVGEENGNTMILEGKGAGQAKTFALSIDPSTVNDQITNIIAVAANEMLVDLRVDGNDIEVTGERAGTTSIVALVTTKNGAILQKTFKVTVTAVPMTAENFSLNKESVDLTAGGTESVALSVVDLAANCTDILMSVTWSTNDESVATVTDNNNGATITAVGAGNATITATVKTLYTTITKTISVAVTAT